MHFKSSNIETWYFGHHSSGSLTLNWYYFNRSRISLFSVILSASDIFPSYLQSFSVLFIKSQKVPRDWRPFPDSIFVIKTRRISSAYAWEKSRSDDHSLGPFEIPVTWQSRRGMRESFDGIVRYMPLGYTLMSPFGKKKSPSGLPL